MPDIEDLNSKDFCDNVVSINGMQLANIVSINTLLQDCVTCAEIILGPSHFSCGRACVAECIAHYTDGDTAANLVTGDHIYENEECTCPGNTSNIYYSNKCGGRSGVCYTINPADCEIISVTSC